MLALFAILAINRGGAGEFVGPELKPVQTPVPLVAPPQEHQRLRTILPNGAVIFVEQNEQARKLVVQLFISSRGAPDTPSTEGYRHLLEHLVAKGRSGDIDQRLESRGAFLTAQTSREATEFNLVLRPSDLSLGMETITALMQLAEVTADQVKHESAIIRQEVALEDAPHLLASAAWSAAYGDGGLDPMGKPNELENADPEAILRLHKQMFTGGAIAVVISGNVGLDEATLAAQNAIGAIPPSTALPDSARTFLNGGITSVDADGEALACKVGSWNAPSTAARLAAALAIASGISNSFVTYTPSIRGGLIIVGRTGETSGLSRLVRDLKAPNEFAVGRSLAQRWVERETNTQAGGLLSGLLLVEGAGQKPATALDNLTKMTPSEFESALNDFRGKDTVEVLGR